MVRRTEGTKRRVWEAVEVDIPHHAGAIRIGGASNLAADFGGSFVWENSLIGNPRGVIGGDGSIAKLASRLSERDSGEEGGRNDCGLHLESEVAGGHEG
jgi:hypothetical protein